MRTEALRSKGSLSVSLLARRDHAAFTLGISGVQLGGTPTISYRSQKKALKMSRCQKAVSRLKSDVSSPPGDRRAAAFWQFALQRQLRRGSFYPYFCWAALWETWVLTVPTRSGSLPVPKDCKMPCKVLYASTLALIPWQCIFCTRFYQMLLLPHPQLKPAQTHCFPLLLICGGGFSSCAARDTASYNLTLKDS